MNMTKNEVSKILNENLKLAKTERESIAKIPELVKVKKSLRRFQIERLKKTHSSLLTSPDTKVATEFFLNELYGEKDLSKRDRDLEKLIPMMEKVFPANLLEVIMRAIVLDALTEKLDNVMVKYLKENFTEKEYDEVYKKYTSKEDRKKQIELVESLGNSLCEFVYLPFIETTLKMMTIPAKLANLTDMHVFLSNGLNAFRSTRNPRLFIQNLVGKEKEVLEKTYS